MIPRHRPEYSLKDLFVALKPAEDCLGRLSADLNRSFAMWVPSGRAGLSLLLRAVEAKAAIVPAFNCWAVIEGLAHASVEPVFVDVGQDLNADLNQTLCAIERASPGTVLILTHQFGIPICSASLLIEAARSKGMAVIEDGAAAVGGVSDLGPVGSAGDASVFSFQFTKSVLAGEGGLVLAGDQLATALKREGKDFRQRTRSESLSQWLKLAALALFTNPRLYAFTLYRRVASVGTLNQKGSVAPAEVFEALPAPWMRNLASQTQSRLNAVLAARRGVASRYLEALRDLPVTMVPAVASPAAAPIRFPVLVENRNQVVRRCAGGGLDLGRSFSYVCSPGGFPGAEKVASQIVNLPLSQRLENCVPRTIEIFREAVLGG